jgi:hypothetical protein
MADHAISRLGPHGLPVTAESSLAERIRSEFLEMRGFSPTFDQARRLFHLPADACLGILESLIHDGFLQCGGDGRYRLADRR